MMIVIAIIIIGRRRRRMEWRREREEGGGEIIFIKMLNIFSVINNHWYPFWSMRKLSPRKVFN